MDTNKVLSKFDRKGMLVLYGILGLIFLTAFIALITVCAMCVCCCL